MNDEAKPEETPVTTTPAATPTTPKTPEASAPTTGGGLRALFVLPEAIGWRDHVIALTLAAVYVAWLLATARSLGFARDEGFYFHAAQTYARWFTMLVEHPGDALKQQAIDAAWQENHEHPSLVKSLFAFSWMLFHEKFHVFADASTAFRFPGMLMMGVALWVTYLFGARAYSRRAGLVAATLLGLMPRVFFNAHLACFDVPILAMWTWCIYVYWRSQVEGGPWWWLATGVVYGLTLDTKHNAWVLPAVMITHSLLVNGRALASKQRPFDWRRALPGSLVAMLLIGPAVCFALWPWLWHDTTARLEWWFDYHFNHVYYNMEYLHVTYFSAPSPRTYMPVMILATVPTVTIVLLVIGFAMRATAHVKRLRAWMANDDDPDGTPAAKAEPAPGDAAPSRKLELAETDLLFFLAAGVALGSWLLPRTPIFGGTKHWFPAYPFLCLFAGYAFDRVAVRTRDFARAMRSWKDERLALVGAEAALVLCVVLAPLAETAHSHPFGLSAYVPLVGGTAGGADLGLNRQFWGFTTESLAPYFAANAPRGASVYFHDTAWDSWRQLQEEKRIRPDLRGAGSPDADFAIVHLERHMLEVEYNEWSVFGTDIPDYVLTHDGVPIIDVFRKKPR